ncbi:hypothetical protein K7432_015298 [Basidiobolus ranarum]|uniref:VTT domain-containing protein n=1 Tax=Basidiobolus ranarum TaxID=34480 RepID=A0ABR2WGD2_9FUNG
MRFIGKHSTVRTYINNHNQFFKWLFRGLLIVSLLGVLIPVGIYVPPYLQPFLHRMQLVPLGWLWVALAYIPLLMVFAPRSLVGGGVGFVFGPTLGFAIDIFGFTLATISIWVVCQGLKRIINVDNTSENAREVKDEEEDTDTDTDSVRLTHFKPSMERHNSDTSYASQTSNLSAFSLGSEDEMLIEEDPMEGTAASSQRIPNNELIVGQSFLGKAGKRLRVLSRLYERVGGWKLVLFANISPAFPVSLTSYILSFTTIPFYQYEIMTILSNIPYCLLYVMIGASARSWADLTSGEGQAWWQWLILAIGLASTIGFVTWLGRLTVKFSKELDEEEEVNLISAVEDDV